MFAAVIKRQVRGAAQLVIDALGHIDLAGAGERFEPGRDIDAVAVDIAGIDDHVAGVDADAQLDPAVGGDTGIPLYHAALYSDAAANCVGGAVELDKQPV